MPTWMILIGVVSAIAGGLILFGVASSTAAQADDMQLFNDYLARQDDPHCRR
jgi:hypothetical protein